MLGRSEDVTVLVVRGDDIDAERLAEGLAEHGDGVSTQVAHDFDATKSAPRGAVDVVLRPAGAPPTAGTEPVTSVRQLADVPVVVIADGTADAVEFLDSGAADCVEHPDDPGALRLVANRLRLAAERAEARTEAREAWRRYRRLLDASPGAIAIHDREGEVLYANERATEIAGATDPSEVIGRNVLSFVPDAETQGARAAIERVVEDREPVENDEVEFVGLDGQARVVEYSSIPVTADGEPAGQISVVDLTALKERERRLREERDRFTTLFESIPEPAIHADVGEGGRVARNVNSAFEEVFGFDADAVLGRSIDEFLVPEDATAEAAEIDRMCRGEREVEREVRRLTTDGEREFLFRAQSVETAGEQPESLGIYVDISEQKRRRAALERQNERLDAFASIVSHDLQSPLSVAKGNLALAEADDDHVRKADAALDRMERIIEDMLRLARADEGCVDPEPVRTSEAVTTAWQVLDVPHATLHNEWDRTILADDGQIRELLGNLFRNAVEHGATGPRAEARGDATEHGSSNSRNGSGSDGATGRGGENVNVYVAGTDDGFYVADDGPGIPHGLRRQVFEPGFTTDEDGTGFGLVVVNEIAEAHGWTVTAEESDAGGARFRFGGVETVEGG